ncbi:hypothetical protein [Xanthomonas hortorum]|uniref:hypothetical protein n=1 Tax=Xanthomonas hortorum TaxID=56454 RepID=UPI000D47AD43|nr:hypothetical protein [Xanthomonas hortorum]PPU39660.1 hypothetical protein XcyCFBP4188_16435 [Xanthomonas hortorum pv. cynarae]CAD0307083.1 hypothetical protein CFBP2044_07820 [Xanthomonas hortorum pv. cynarae]CAD0307089.1 hypothetical protein CFBP2044_07820 [Xanthomonas hortorum pv. cynarae]
MGRCSNVVAAHGPRLRDGQVHLFNNLHLGDRSDADDPRNHYAHGEPPAGMDAASLPAAAERQCLHGGADVT